MEYVPPPVSSNASPGPDTFQVVPNLRCRLYSSPVFTSVRGVDPDLYVSFTGLLVNSVTIVSDGRLLSLKSCPVSKPDTWKPESLKIEHM